MITLREIFDCVIFLAVAVFLSWMLNGCTAKPVKVSCIAPAYPTAHIQAVADEFGAKWFSFNGKARLIITKFYNDITDSSIKPDIIGFYDKGGKRVMLVFIKSGCVLDVANVEVELLRVLLFGEAV